MLINNYSIRKEYSFLRNNLSLENAKWKKHIWHDNLQRQKIFILDVRFELKFSSFNRFEIKLVINTIAYLLKCQTLI